MAAAVALCSIPQPEGLQPAPLVAPPPGIPLCHVGAGCAALIDLRHAARRARALPPLPLGAAHTAPGRTTETIVRVLGEVLGRRPVFHAPGDGTASFDEAWLLRCHEAQARKDADSLAFLVRSRVDPARRRPFLDLMRRL